MALAALCLLGVCHCQQSSTVLRGGVQQTQNLDTSPYHVQQLVVEIYHIATILKGRRDAATEARYRSDVAEFDALKQAGAQQRCDFLVSCSTWTRNDRFLQEKMKTSAV